VSRADGTVVGEFTESRAGGGWSSTRAIEAAMKPAVKNIGLMIYTGQYRRNAPAGRPAARAFQSATPVNERAETPTAMERLRTLDRLRAEGMVTPQEYESKRREIVGGI
jgi:cytochrome c-type biogenesis protein CcmH/NrfG